MSLANECIPYKEPGGRLTGVATAAVTGKRGVVVTGDLQADGLLSVGPAGAGARIVGVAVHDAAIDRRVTIIATPGVVIPMTAGAAIVANTEVVMDADARVIPQTTTTPGVAVGLALDGVGTVGADVMIKLYGV